MTEAGRVTEQATVQSDEQTPLNRQLTRLSKLIGRAGIALSVAIFCVMLGKRRSSSVGCSSATGSKYRSRCCTFSWSRWPSS